MSTSASTSSTNSSTASDYGTPDDIKRKIRQNVYETEAKDAARNPLWQHFRAIICAQVDGERCTIPFVSCAKCDTILSYSSARSGTSHLRRHADACYATSSTGTASVANFFKSSSVPKAAKDYIIDKCVDFVCKDIRPFNAINGPGFQELVQALINVGVQYGQVRASEVLPDCTTVSDHVDKRAASLKESVVIPEIKKFINVWGYSRNKKVYQCVGWWCHNRYVD